MLAVKVTFDNGNTIFSDFNAEVSREEMAKYYMGNWFNIGSVSDDMHKAVKVEFPDREEKFKSESEYKALIENADIKIIA